ncbi:condensation domain-containing protein [Streptomyces albus subsp. chlorinus]|uniref:condensation domain-containing protein n=1 Tax=Streptomyces albus TaxID=1888 RepID=UPI00156FBD97
MVQETGEHALTSCQAQVWAAGKLAGGAVQRGYYAVLPGELSPARLADAVAALVGRHPALRTRIVRGGGGLRQRTDGARPALEQVDHPDVPLAEAVAAVLDEVRVDVSGGPPAYFAIVRASGGARALVVAVHLAVADGWSRGILLRELDQFLSTGTFAPAPRLAPGEIADLHEARRTAPEYRRRLAHWAEHLPSRPPGGAALGGGGTRGGVRHARALAPAVVAGVRAESGRARVSPSAAYLAGVVAAVSPALSTVCVLTSGRTAEVGSTVGVFANHLPLPVDPAAVAEGGLDRLWASMVAALRNEVPLPELAEAFPERRAALAAVTQGGVSFQVAPPWPRFTCLPFLPYHRGEASEVPFSAMAASIREQAGGTGWDVVHDPSRCDEDRAVGLFAGAAEYWARWR